MSSNTPSVVGAETVSTQAAQRSRSVQRRPRALVQSLVSRYAAVMVLALLIAVFSLARPETFPTWANATIILSTQTVVVIAALGTMVPLIAGEFDLSVGYVLGFSAMVVAKLCSSGWNPALAALAAVGCCLLVGLVNGLLVVWLGLSAFIATLGMGTVLSGVVIWMSEGTVVRGVPESLLHFGRATLFGIQAPVFYMVLIVLIAWYVLEMTPYGRYLYAIGGGQEAARLAGLPTGWLRVSAFVVSAAAAAVAGVIATSSLGSASAGYGPSYLLPAFAACFLGATTIKPGRFNARGTVVALFLLAVGIAGLQQVGAPFWVGPVFNGSALIVAVGLAVARSKPR